MRHRRSNMAEGAAGRTRAIGIIGILLVFLLSPAPRALTPEIYGQEKEKRLPISEYDFPGLEKNISLDIRNMEIVHFLKFLAVEGELNIVASDNVTGAVSLLISEVTIGDALEIVFSLNNLAYEVIGNVIKVITNDEYKVLYGVNFYDQRKTAMYQLEYASATNVATILGNVKSDIGKIIYDATTGTIILIDTPEKISEMEEIIERQELPTVSRVIPTETRVFEFQYTKVEDVKDEISNALTVDIGTIRADTRTNTLIVTDLPHVIEKVETMVKAFDRKTREVFIEAKVVEVLLADTFKWGVDWDKVLEMSGMASKYAITPEVALPLTLTTFGKLTVNSVNTTDSLSLVIEVLDTLTETKIISNPHITVEDGKEAKIEVIEKQPYQEETTTTASGGTTTTSKTYQWVDVGVVLNVTPTINKEGYISMLIKPEVSSISSWYGGAEQAAGAVPVVKSANAETTVTIKDGVTILIAGLIIDKKTKTFNKVPILGDIPILGKAFQSDSDDIRRTETIVFLTPRIVEGNRAFLLERDKAKEIKGIRK